MDNTVHGGAAVGMFILMMTIALSGSFSWASYAADYSRYMKKDQPSNKVFLATLGGLGASYIWVYTIGLAGAKVLNDQTAAGVRSLMGGGFLGVLALIAIVFGGITGCVMNDYSASLASQAGGLKVKRPIVAAVSTVFAFFLILWLHSGDTSTKFQNVLLFSSYWIAPFFAVLLIDWYARGKQVGRRTAMGLLDLRKLHPGWPALAALVVGFAAMIPFMDSGLYEGPVSKAWDGADVSFYVGFIVAAIIYYPLRQFAVKATPTEDRAETATLV
jgi:NCS1 family nucleobase:cation symporter-1